MSATTVAAPERSVREYRSELKPIWCPGCGDYGVVQAIYRALAAIGRPPHEVAFVSGIGCSSRIPGYTTAYGFNSVHGRALPIAQGIKLANPELLVLVAGGDGDGFSIGGGHVAHAIRRNVDLTYVVMDNQIYGLTKGQLSPTSRVGARTASSPFGSLESPVNPLLYVLGYGASFVAQGTPADMGGLASVIEQAIRHPGFAFVNVQSPCVTFGDPEWQLKQHKSAIRSAQALGHDTADRARALAIAEDYGRSLYNGVLYRDPEPPPTYEDGIRERHAALRDTAPPRHRILEMFRPGRDAATPASAPRP
jgi:2-oxoglutarate ferredoxin oxidoreductase subunit beta